MGFNVRHFHHRQSGSMRSAFLIRLSRRPWPKPAWWLDVKAVAGIANGGNLVPASGNLCILTAAIMLGCLVSGQKQTLIAIQDDATGKILVCAVMAGRDYWGDHVRSLARDIGIWDMHVIILRPGQLGLSYTQGRRQGGSAEPDTGGRGPGQAGDRAHPLLQSSSEEVVENG